MPTIAARFVGVELYFDDLERAKAFYGQTLGLDVADERPVTTQSSAMTLYGW